ncbi:MAG: 50S ribosomal protein L10 [Robiginitomaculum sp.]|nr:50S ribosomal protein L10 [Robiginitomaculum sp.]
MIGKDFFRKEEDTLALSKQRKQEVLAQYQDWVNRSQAVILVEYTGATVKDMEAIRSSVRESGGEFHVVKNTLMKRVLEENNLAIPEGYLEHSTAIGFAFSDVASTTKALADASKDMDALKFKGGYMGSELLSPEQVIALSKLPPLPVLQAQLLGVLQAPAGKLVRTVAEPARGLAAVIKAYSGESASTAA